MEKIDIMIGGMQKGGTTALARYLEQHPAIESHPQMEMTFFYDAAEYARGWQACTNNYFFDTRGSAGGKQLLAKHATLIRSKEALKRLLDHNPDVKLLLTFRNPVDRAWSSFLMEVGQGEANTTFTTAAEKVVEQEKIDTSDWRQNIYFGFGLYVNFLNLVYEVLPEKQVKIVFLEEVVSEPERTLIEVFSWLGLSSDHYDFSVTAKKVNAYAAPKSYTLGRIIRQLLAQNNPLKSMLKKVLHPKIQYKLGDGLRDLNKKPAAPPKLDLNLRAKLNEFYAPYNQQLAERLNKDLSFWNN